MITSIPFNLAVLLSIAPVAVYAVKRGGERDGLFWMLMAVAVVGPFSLIIGEIAGQGWQTSFGFSLWVTVSASMGLFAILTVLEPNAYRLTPLVAPYMMILGLFGMVWGHFEAADGLSADGHFGWVELHIAISVMTYAMVTLAAMAALAGLLQERALKAKKRTALNGLLPSVADSDILLFKLLALGEVVLGLGLITGMATQYSEVGQILTLDHKTMLTIAAFIVIGVMLLVHHFSGLRGRTVTRLVLLVYLLMSLGYPGVKFVTDHLV